MHSGRSVKDVFNEALEYPTSDRAAFLDRECAGDTKLRSRVERLLGAHERGTRFLASQREVLASVRSESASVEGPGTVIGRYRLLEMIGEGGFGSVFLAEQQEPVNRRVALKIIKLGMDTRQVIARFEAERQALAMMDHPNIARVLDAGATESGRPYFVMELVHGDPITQYCDACDMDTDDRLDLFVQVCHAVQHAHQKGIIHRDLKPSNVLVAEVDGRPRPKIIDFGIAKAVEGRLTDHTLFTEFRQLIGTPEYMAPEQAAGPDVDTRSDIYSLGVLLYELLAGSPPFDPQRLRSAAWNELLSIIAEETPPRPSTRISMMKDAASVVAAHRRSEPDRLRRRLRGDLDWIVMRCLEKDRNRRYATANALAMDVQRHLREEPVAAGPPSVAYRLGKFLRRWRVPVTVGTAGFLLLIGATVLSTSLWLRASANAARAVEAESAATDKLWESYLSQVQARRRTPDMGRRFESLRIIGDMAAIRPSMEVRNEAIAALALLDARKIASTPDFGADLAFGSSPSVDWFLLSRPNGETEIRDIAGDSTRGVIPRRISGRAWIQTVSFSADGTRGAVRTVGVDGRIVAGVWDFTSTSCLVEIPTEGRFALSPDGMSLAVADVHGVRVYDVDTGQERWRRPCVESVFLSIRPRHEQVCVIPRLERTMWLFSARTGELEREVELPAAVGGINWSQDGDRVALGCTDATVYVSEPGNLDSWINLNGHQALVTELDFDPRGSYLLTDSWDATARVWDLLTHQCVLVLPDGKSWLTHSPERLIAFESTSPNTRRFAHYELARSSVFRCAVARQGGLETTERPLLAHHPTIPVVVTGLASSSTLIFWTPGMDRVLGAYETDPVNGIAFSHAGDAFYTTGEAGLQRHACELIDDVLFVGPRTTVLTQPGDAVGLSNRELAAIVLPVGSARAAHKITLDGTPSVESRTLHAPSMGLTVSPGGEYAAFFTWHHRDVSIWDLRDGSMRVLGLDTPAFACFSPDVRHLAASAWGSDHVFDVSTWSEVGRFEVLDAMPYPARAAYSPDGTLYARPIGMNRVRLFDAATFTELATLEAPVPFAIHCVAFSRDGRALLAATNRAHVVYVWDLWELRNELRGLGLDWPAPAMATPPREPRSVRGMHVIHEPVP